MSLWAENRFSYCQPNGMLRLLFGFYYYLFSELSN
jgi:serine/threonine protein kinase